GLDRRAFGHQREHLDGTAGAGSRCEHRPHAVGDGESVRSTGPVRFDASSWLMLAGILSLQQPVVRRFGIVLVAGAFVFRAAAVFGTAPWMIIGETLFSLLFLAALILIVFRQVSQEGPVSAHRVRGAIALYLLIAMLFAFLYGLAEELAPGAFNLPGSLAGGMARGETFYYFSVVTLTTVGFGDITAVHPFVRSLVMLEALIGQLYPAILIARLVTLQLETRRSGK
ncbi:MAG: hypothetical protein HGB21_09885, partial [Nitrospirae bacterium]|nr:hypothetical protein [Nitrospirota bacterium]